MIRLLAQLIKAGLFLQMDRLHLNMYIGMLLQGIGLVGTSDVFFFFNLRGEFDIGSLGFSVLLFLSFSHINARGDCYNSTSRLRVILLFSCVTSKENDLLQEERLPAAAGRRKGSPPKKRIRCWCCSLLLLLLLLL